MSQEFRFKNIDGTRNYFLEEIERNEFIGKKHKKFCTTLTLSYFSFCNYWMYFNLCFCYSAQYFYWNYELGLKTCAIAAGLKTYKSIIKKK